ncbi:MAG: hypothetical protein OXQ29_19750 [Rhodospirillaceae bacterium]|nr:hypothetical protein [Rhodospirillaceae bacterium]
MTEVRAAALPDIAERVVLRIHHDDFGGGGRVGRPGDRGTQRLAPERVVDDGLLSLPK